MSLAERSIHWPLAPVSRLQEWLQPATRISLGDADIQTLIPSQLRLLANGNHLQSLRLETELGRFDDSFEPALSVLVIEKDGLSEPASMQEKEDSVWSRVINLRRQRAIGKGLLATRDRVLISLIADNSWRTDGLYVLSYADLISLRGQGLGRAFFENLERWAAALGFKFIYGRHNKENLGFFLRIGRYLVSQLEEKCLAKPPLVHPEVVEEAKTSTIRFLDREMEKMCVQPEFLRRDGSDITFS